MGRPSSIFPTMPMCGAYATLSPAYGNRLTSPAERVRAKIRESKVETVLPGAVANPNVMIEITSICNFACTYCVSPMKLREKKQMSMDTFRQVMEQVATITTKPVSCISMANPRRIRISRKWRCW